jgi:hypothetical protein
MRQQLAEEVPRELDPGSRTGAIDNPAWRTDRIAEPLAGVSLAFRHPGFGWLGYLLPFQRAKALAQSLLRQSQSVQEEKDGP